MEFFWSIVGFVIMMGLIVTIHEYGHFQVARWFNIKVTDFSIGFGKALYQRQMGEVSFKIAAIPLGGYVKFVDEREGEVAAEDLPRAFNRQSVYKRFAVVLAGPMINLILAWFVFATMNMIGMNTVKPMIDSQTVAHFQNESLPAGEVSVPQITDLWEVTQINQKPVYSWQNVQQEVLLALIDKQPTMEVEFTNFVDSRRQYAALSLDSLDINDTKQNWLRTLGFNPANLPIDAIVGQVLEAGAAQKAGLQVGDKILRFNGELVQSWQDFVRNVQVNPDKQVTLEIQRANQVIQKTVLIESKLDPENKQLVGMIGLGVEVLDAQMQPYMNHVQLGFTQAMLTGYERSIDLIQMSFQMLQRMIMGEVSLSHLSGPISIAQFSGQAVQNGLISFLSLLGLLSLSIGFLNLLPIPVLDGGHLLYYVIEMIKGSPVSDKVMLVGQNIGLFFIISLTLLALFNDFIRLSNG